MATAAFFIQNPHQLGLEQRNDLHIAEVLLQLGHHVKIFCSNLGPQPLPLAHDKLEYLPYIKKWNFLSFFKLLPLLQFHQPQFIFLTYLDSTILPSFPFLLPRFRNLLPKSEIIISLGPPPPNVRDLDQADYILNPAKNSHFLNLTPIPWDMLYYTKDLEIEMSSPLEFPYLFIPFVKKIDDLKTTSIKNFRDFRKKHEEGRIVFHWDQGQIPPLEQKIRHRTLNSWFGSLWHHSNEWEDQNLFTLVQHSSSVHIEHLSDFNQIQYLKQIVSRFEIGLWNADLQKLDWVAQTDHHSNTLNRYLNL